MALDTDDEQPQINSPEHKGKPNLRHWRAQWAAAEKAAESHLEDAADAWKEWLAGRNQAKNEMKAKGSRYPIYWASVRVLQPALYSRTPIPIAEKAFDTMHDPVARLAAVCAERLSKYQMRACNFDRVMYSTRDDFLHAAKATCRVIFDADIQSNVTRTAYTQGADPNRFYNDAGEEYEGGELEQDENGYFAESIEETIESANCGVIPQSYKDYLHTPNARHWEEIDWIRFRNPMTKKECVKRFGEDVAKQLPYKSLSQEKEKKDVVANIPTQYAFIGETWDKSNRQVYWDCEGHEDGFLDVKPDPYELEGFFPCTPFMLGTIGADNLYPVPDFVQLKPFIDQLHACADRFRILVASARVLGVYDADFDNDLAALNSLDSESVFLAVGRLKKLIKEGGLDSIIEFFPIEKIVEGVNQMAQVIALYEQKFYEIYGVPDILRGISDPRETAAAQQQKGKFTSLMFTAVQREMQRVARDAIQMMADLALKKMPMEMLANIMGYQYMKPEEQQLFPQALQLLQNDKQRLIRVDIETDSTITMNQNAEIEQVNYLAKSLFDGLAAVSSVMESAPELKPVLMETLLMVVRKLQQGKQVEESLEAAIQQAMAPKPDAQEPPDPALVKAQVEQQRMQQEGQLRMQELQLEAAQMNAKHALEMQKLALQSRELESTTQGEVFKGMLDKENSDFDKAMKVLEHKLEEYRVVLDEKEKFMEERRLSNEENATPAITVNVENKGAEL